MLVSFENVRYLLIAFPLIPLVTIILSVLINYVSKKDISPVSLIVNNLLQLVVGLLLVARFIDYEGVHIESITQWQYSIIFVFDRIKVYFLIAFLLPLLFSLFHTKSLQKLESRLIFLFYLSGCSGLIVTGDIFNFYIFYEVMIMSAYILVAINGNYYASIKYMLFGAISSALLLAGIILLYASGAYFSFTFVQEIGELSLYNIKFVLLLFCTAFFIKGAFFPVSSWVATCHSATNNISSSFLSAFTIFTGIYGLYYFVLQPAMLLEYEQIFLVVKIFSMITMLLPALILYFEPEFKRCIAGSTVYSIGFIGLMMSYRLFDLAFTYMAIHACYKPLMFLLHDYVEIKGNAIRANKRTLAIYMVCILFTAGFFPSLIYFIKYNLLQDYAGLTVLTQISMMLILSSFLKFRFKIIRFKAGNVFYITILCIILLIYFLYPFRFVMPDYKFILDAGIILFAIFLSGKLYQKWHKLSALDTKFIFKTLNVEIFYVVILLVSQLLILRLVF